MNFENNHLCRAKRIDNAIWVYGLFCVNTLGKPCIQIRTRPGSWQWTELHEIDPTTIGKFIGIKNKSNSMIFQGDVLRNKKGEEGVVVWIPERARFELHSENKKGIEYWITLDKKFCWYKEVSGNIHE